MLCPALTSKHEAHPREGRLCRLGMLGGGPPWAASHLGSLNLPRPEQPTDLRLQVLWQACFASEAPSTAVRNRRRLGVTRLRVGREWSTVALRVKCRDWAPALQGSIGVIDGRAEVPRACRTLTSKDGLRCGVWLIRMIRQDGVRGSQARATAPEASSRYRLSV